MDNKKLLKLQTTDGIFTDIRTIGDVAHVARQQHIHTEKEDYNIDRVFYNYIFIGQMDRYIRGSDEVKETEN